MNFSTIPIICGVTLAAMTAAGISHWWSLRQLSSVLLHQETRELHTDLTPAIAEVIPLETQETAPTTPAPHTAAVEVVSEPSETAPLQKQFYEKMLSRMESLQHQNSDLLDQLAETNRDLMKLEFRVDTHSESFRPLPVSEDKPFNSFDDDLGVLPPRAEPVILPDLE